MDKPLNKRNMHGRRKFMCDTPFASAGNFKLFNHNNAISSILDRKYTIDTAADGSFATINFPGIEIYDSYRNLLFLNYDRNQSVQKNEDGNGRNTYTFKFRGGEVSITFDNSQHCALCILYILGNGHKKWLDEALGIFDKQYKRLQSGEIRIPEDIKTGENKKPLVSEEEFRGFFAIPNKYRTYYLEWPRHTIILYKYSSNATSKYWGIPEDTWKKIVNKPFKKDKCDGTCGKHAEEIMIEDLENIQDYLTIQPDDNDGSYKAILSVEVIQSYSPCYPCSLQLCRLKKQLEEKVKQSKTRNKDSDTVLENFYTLSQTPEIEEEEKIKFKITFSNFYNHFKKYNGIMENMYGLKDLIRNNIKLDVFTDNNWDYFFKAAGLHVVTETPERQQRELDDWKILRYLEGFVVLERLPADLDAMEKDLRKNKLL